MTMGPTISSCIYLVCAPIGQPQPWQRLRLFCEKLLIISDRNFESPGPQQFCPSPFFSPVSFLTIASLGYPLKRCPYGSAVTFVGWLWREFAVSFRQPSVLNGLRNSLIMWIPNLWCNFAGNNSSKVNRLKPSLL